MSSAVLAKLERRLSVLAGIAQPLRVLLALASLLAFTEHLQRPDTVIPLFLGVIACGLAETDDSWQGRLRAQVVTLACFAGAAYATLALFDHDWLFIASLALAAVGLTLLGAVEARYRAIGYATLILAIYAVIGISNLPAGSDRRHEPALLLAGAAWYGLISVVSAAAFPSTPVRTQLVKLYTVLGDFVRLKASLFEPIRGVNVEQKRLSLAWLNAQVVAELNASKESLFRRTSAGEMAAAGGDGAPTVGARPPTSRMARYRGLYLIAQDVHERASSSHDDYNALADTFFHSDLLYRAKRVLSLQGDACTRLAKSIARGDAFVADTSTVQALSELRSAIDHARADARGPGQDEREALLGSMEALARNLAQLDGQLTGASQPSALAGRTDFGLFDRSPQGWRDAFARIRRQLTTRSVLFRHALRLAIALTVGYALMRVIHPAQGYWIMLTTLFVLQQTYGDTVSRMSQRIAGTVIGVIAGWALLRLFPQAPVQAAIAVAAGVIFFATRGTRYLVATAAMTVLVMLCFERVGDSHTLIVPRLVDTIIGSVIAAFAVLLVLPNRQASHFNEIAAAALRSNAGYLDQIVEQYRRGARDDLAYRLARRNAHNADAALSNAVTDMFREPGHGRTRVEAAMRLLIQSHTLLNYLSALGAHRVALSHAPGAATLLEGAQGVASALTVVADELARASATAQPSKNERPPEILTAARLGNGQTPVHRPASLTTDATDEAQPTSEGPTPARAALIAMQIGTTPDDAAERLVRTELLLIWMQADRLREHAREWLADKPREAAAPPTTQTNDARVTT